MNIPISSHIIFFILISFFLIIVETHRYSNTSDSIELGKQIYTTGIGENNAEIMAYTFGREMPAKLFACSKCHGECGKAKLQQGMDIPDIRRVSYLNRNFNNNEKENIDEIVNSKIKRFILSGINHTGDKVNSMMPTYNMSLKDMDHLLAYLAILGTEENCIN